MRFHWVAWQSGNMSDFPYTSWTSLKFSTISGNFKFVRMHSDCPETFQTVWKFFRLSGNLCIFHKLLWISGNFPKTQYFLKIFQTTQRLWYYLEPFILSETLWKPPGNFQDFLEMLCLESGKPSRIFPNCMKRYKLHKTLKLS